MGLAAALSLMAVAPAHADKQICDGSTLCWMGVLPVVVVGAVYEGLVAPPEKYAENYIRDGKHAQLEFLLASHPAMAKDARRGTPLLKVAVAKSNMTAAKMLINAGASARDGDVLVAATSPEMMRYLMASGAAAADVKLSRMDRYFTQRKAVEQLLMILDARAALDPDDEEAKDLLSRAVSSEKGDVVRLLLERGVNPNGGGYRSPLLVAARSCRTTSTPNEVAMLAIAQDLLTGTAIDPSIRAEASHMADRRDCLDLARLIDRNGRPAAPVTPD